MSLRPSNQLLCAIRKQFVQETPEERVRQQTLSSLFLLGYSPSLTVVERKIAELPHLSGQVRMPNRRIDILCYEAATMQPLLLVECKAKSFSDKELRQLLGYNFYIQARYVALSCPDRVLLYDAASGTSYNEFFSIK